MSSVRGGGGCGGELSLWAFFTSCSFFFFLFLPRKRNFGQRFISHSAHVTSSPPAVAGLTAAPKIEKKTKHIKKLFFQCCLFLHCQFASSCNSRYQTHTASYSHLELQKQKWWIDSVGLAQKENQPELQQLCDVRLHHLWMGMLETMDLLPTLLPDFESQKNKHRKDNFSRQRLKRKHCCFFRVIWEASWKAKQLPTVIEEAYRENLMASKLLLLFNGNC